ncbi:MAG: hypothetical protein BGO67_08545 [Alphaproteobacteria bacterium 41-28]|nr:MAG: hypothetical protein BGO67_08545 [Alphaproteobacteria bacterium 41-28]
MLNKVILQGNIGRTPKVWLTQEGREIATLSLATSSFWKDANGELQTCVEWHRVTVFRESTVTWIKNSLKKGDCIYVEGKLTYQQWTDKFGQSRYTPHVVVTGREGRIEYLRSRLQEPTPVNPEAMISGTQNSQPKQSEFPEQPLEKKHLLEVLPSSLPEEESSSNQPCQNTDPITSH